MPSIIAGWHILRLAGPILIAVFCVFLGLAVKVLKKGEEVLEEEVEELELELKKHEAVESKKHDYADGKDAQTKTNPLVVRSLQQDGGDVHEVAVASPQVQVALTEPAAV